jgi:hypothetical protein
MTMLDIRYRERHSELWQLSEGGTKELTYRHLPDDVQQRISPQAMRAMCQMGVLTQASRTNHGGIGYHVKPWANSYR